MAKSVNKQLTETKTASRGLEGLREFWQTIDHPATGPLTYPGPGYRISGYVAPMGRAPVLGEHPSLMEQERSTPWLRKPALDTVS